MEIWPSSSILEQQELGRGQSGLLIRRLGVHVDGTDDLAQGDQHFIMFSMGSGSSQGCGRGANSPPNP